MKKIIATVFALGLTTSAYAEDNFSISLGGERNLESEVNTLYINPVVTSGNISISAQGNIEDTAAKNGSFSWASTDLDISYNMLDHISIYVENNFNSDFKHTSTIVGGKVTF